VEVPVEEADAAAAPVLEVVAPLVQVEKAAARRHH
jgi:hypothetical protein